MQGKLVLTGMPIGNAEDISARAVRVLRQADMVLAEHPAAAQTALCSIGAERETTAFLPYLREDRLYELVGLMQAGKTLVLISDAGMPGFADPGERLISLCHESGVGVTVVPGANAAICALVLSGFCTSGFSFEGFLTTASAGRRQRLHELLLLQAPFVLYEAHHKLPATLQDLLRVLGDRRVLVACDLTKPTERAERLTLRKAAARYGAGCPKGEYVLVVDKEKM